jgi:hypothetical protein
MQRRADDVTAARRQVGELLAGSLGGNKGENRNDGEDEQVAYADDSGPR